MFFVDRLAASGVARGFCSADTVFTRARLSFLLVVVPDSTQLIQTQLARHCRLVLRLSLLSNRRRHPTL